MVPDPGTQLFAYADDFLSKNARAPTLPAGLVAEFRAGADTAAAPWTTKTQRGRQVLLRMPWTESPCAYVLVRRPMPARSWSAHALTFGAGLLALLMVGAVWFAAGPLVKRLRKLGRDVEASADTLYETPVADSGHDEVAELARAFNRAGGAVRTKVQELSDREQTLRDFVANTTHDVMIPLTVLQGHVARWRKDTDAGRPSAHEDAHAAVDEAQYIASLLTNLGVMAKLEAGEVHLDLRPVNLCALVSRVIERHRPLAAARQVSLEHAVPLDPIAVTGDVTLLEQAVSNVVHNAVRYNQADGHVAVVLEVDRSTPGTFLLRVIDDGPGIPEAERARATQRSYRGGSARTRRPTGSGLGLHIAQDVAARHGMTLTLDASAHGGLEVTLRGEIP